MTLKMFIPGKARLKVKGNTLGYSWNFYFSSTSSDLLDFLILKKKSFIFFIKRGTAYLHR